jgi:diguanylate cyclase (GGDEF)-like protein/PAS domain S-box-containing protein
VTDRAKPLAGASFALHEHSAQRYALAARAAEQGVWDWDLGSERIHLSAEWQAILGHPEQPGDHELSSWFDLVHPADLLRLRAAIDAHLSGHTSRLDCEHRMRHQDGTWHWVLVRSVAVCEDDGAPSRMAGTLTDVTERVMSEQQLEHDALHDWLTSLPSRTLFLDRLQQVLQRATRDPRCGCAVLVIDIDGLARVNDSLSHAIGDRLLAAIGRRVCGLLRPGDTAARVGGDEFALLLEGVVAAADATVVAERVQAALAREFGVEGHTLSVAAGIGIALSSSGYSARELLCDAEVAMYEAKRRAAPYVFFERGMKQRQADRETVETELRDAVERSQLPVHYQPIVELASGRVQGLEALARWPAGRPALAPLDFIQIAEEIGLIGELGLHVLRTSLDTIARWQRAGLISEDVGVSVNVSSRQLEDPHLPAAVRAAIAQAGLLPHALRLDVTESALMSDTERIQSVVSEVCSTGVVLHLDDFGTGYTSLAALYRLPLAALKIDRSFVAAISSRDADAEAMVRATVALSRSLGLRVIAEGIEDEAQLRRLRALGCEYGQGFLFSAPLCAGDTEALLTSWSAEDVVALAGGSGGSPAPGGI